MPGHEDKSSRMQVLWENKVSHRESEYMYIWIICIFVMVMVNIID